jgi:integrase
VHRWVEGIGMESAIYGMHSMRRAKAAQIYRKTRNLRAVQLLLGHTKLESTVRYLGIEADDALNTAEQIELKTSTTGVMPVVTYAPRSAFENAHVVAAGATRW